MIERKLKNHLGETIIIITTDEINQWVYNEWFGILSVEDVMIGATEVLKVMESSGYTQILNDNRKVIGPWDNANEWIATEWMPQALALGLQHFAHVLSPYYYGALSAEDLQKRVGTTFEMRLYKEIEEAKAWLRESKHVQQI